MNTNEEIENIILSDFKDVNILERVFEVDIVESGTHFCSNPCSFTVRYEKDGQKYEKSFFIKLPYSIPAYETIRNHGIYAREIYTYRTIMSLNKTLLPSDPLAPEFYGTDGRDALILEDLSKEYRMLSRHKQLDFEHCSVVLKLLAKFHAFSVKIHETQPEILHPVRKSNVFINSSTLKDEKFTSMYKDRFSKVFQRANPTFVKEHSSVYEFLKENYLHMWKEENSDKGNVFNVLNHGDLRTNNLMFRYDCYGQVVQAKCVDFQVCRWTSPAIDIIYFAITSMRFEIFEKYLDILLEIYLNTLNATLTYLKCERANLNFEDLRRDIGSKGGVFLFTLIGAAPVVLTNSDMKRNGNPDDDGILDEQLLDEKQYIEFTKLWMSYFVKNCEKIGYYFKDFNVSSTICN